MKIHAIKNAQKHIYGTPYVQAGTILLLWKKTTLTRSHLRILARDEAEKEETPHQQHGAEKENYRTHCMEEVFVGVLGAL